MSKKKTDASKKDEALFDEELIDHVVTQEDLDLNPELAEEGTKVGDVIQIPKEETDDEEDDTKGGVSNEEETKEEVLEEETYNGPIPLWARADGVIPSKKDEENFKTKTVDKPVNREEKLPEYMTA